MAPSTSGFSHPAKRHFAPKTKAAQQRRTPKWLRHTDCAQRSTSVCEAFWSAVLPRRFGLLPRHGVLPVKRGIMTPSTSGFAHPDKRLLTPCEAASHTLRSGFSHPAKRLLAPREAASRTP